MSMDPYNEQRLRDEVIYLHSLWHQGPPRLNPYPNPNHTTSTHLLPPSNPPQFKKPNKRLKRANKTPPQSELEWPCKEYPVDPSPSGWPARTLITRVVLYPEEQAQFAATRIQNKAVTALEGFFAGNLDSDGEGSDGSDEDDEMGGDGYEEYQFFLKLFEEEELRGYCEKNWKGGDFVCLVCSGIGKRKKFKNCVAVVQHSVTVARTKKKKAHRAYAQVLCRVLGWDIDRLPTIDSSLAKPIDSQGNAEVAIGESSMINKDSALENVDKEEELLSSSVPGTSTVISDNVMPCENSLNDGDANKCVENIGNGVQIFGDGNTGVATCMELTTKTHLYQGPPRPNPNPNPNHTTSTHLLPPSNPSEFKKPNKTWPKRHKRANKIPPQSNLQWPCKETPVDPSPSGWPAPTLITRVVLSAEEQAQFAATQIQNNAITALEGFFAGNLDSDGEGSDEDDVMGGDGYEYQFFLKLFEEEEELRWYCEKNWEGGDFVCLVCSGIGKRKRFKNCVAAVQHSVMIERTKKKKAHRAYAQVLCRVLGWDIDRLPTIVSLSAKPIESQGNAEVAIGESSMVNKDSALEKVDDGEIIQKEVPDVDKEEELLSSSVPGTSTVTGDNVMPCENSLKDGDANKCVENIDNGVQSFGDGNTGVATCLEHREVSVDNGHEIRDNEKGIVVVNDQKENYGKAN